MSLGTCVDCGWQAVILWCFSSSSLHFGEGQDPCLRMQRREGGALCVLGWGYQPLCKVALTSQEVSGLARPGWGPPSPSEATSCWTKRPAQWSSVLGRAERAKKQFSLRTQQKENWKLGEAYNKQAPLTQIKSQSQNLCDGKKYRSKWPEHLEGLAVCATYQGPSTRVSKLGPHGWGDAGIPASLGSPAHS